MLHKFDFVIQALIFIWAIFSLANSYAPEEGLLVPGVFMGIWQMISSVINFFRSNPSLLKHRKIHFLTALTYLLIVAIANKTLGYYDDQEFYIFYLPPLALSIYYFIVTAATARTAF